VPHAKTVGEKARPYYTPAIESVPSNRALQRSNKRCEVSRPVPLNSERAPASVADEVTNEAPQYHGGWARVLMLANRGRAEGMPPGADDLGATKLRCRPGTQIFAEEPGLDRAARRTGVSQEANALYWEFEEVGINRQLGYLSPANLIEKYPIFWNSVSMSCRKG
jgi:hypothetical protein